MIVLASKLVYLRRKREINEIWRLISPTLLLGQICSVGPNSEARTFEMRAADRRHEEPNGPEYFRKRRARYALWVRL